MSTPTIFIRKIQKYLEMSPPGWTPQRLFVAAQVELGDLPDDGSFSR